MEPFFVDCHSHVVPSGDDGAKTPELTQELAQRWPLQVNATSLLGWRGAEIEELAGGSSRPETRRWSPPTATG